MNERRLDDLLSPDVVRHCEATPGIVIESIDRFKDLLRADTSIFPDDRQTFEHRPPAFDRAINCVLALEYYGGELLSDAISRAIRDGDKGRLLWRLTAPAYYLATQHNRSVDGTAVEFTADCSYLDVQLGTLRDVGRIGRWDTDELRRPCGLWADRPRMWEDQQVWLHGCRRDGRHVRPRRRAQDLAVRDVDADRQAVREGRRRLRGPGSDEHLRGAVAGASGIRTP
jgi:hypothetical protein